MQPTVTLQCSTCLTCCYPIPFAHIRLRPIPCPQPFPMPKESHHFEPGTLEVGPSYADAKEIRAPRYGGGHEDEDTRGPPHACTCLYNTIPYHTRLRSLCPCPCLGTHALAQLFGTCLTNHIAAATSTPLQPFTTAASRAACRCTAHSHVFRRTAVHSRASCICSNQRTFASVTPTLTTTCVHVSTDNFEDGVGGLNLLPGIGAGEYYM